jgi:hypothetical protein
METPASILAMTCVVNSHPLMKAARLRTVIENIVKKASPDWWPKTFGDKIGPAMGSTIGQTAIGAGLGGIGSYVASRVMGRKKRDSGTDALIGALLGGSAGAGKGLYEGLQNPPPPKPGSALDPNSRTFKYVHAGGGRSWGDTLLDKVDVGWNNLAYTVPTGAALGLRSSIRNQGEKTFLNFKKLLGDKTQYPTANPGQALADYDTQYAAHLSASGGPNAKAVATREALMSLSPLERLQAMAMNTKNPDLPNTLWERGTWGVASLKNQLFSKVVGEDVATNALFKDLMRQSRQPLGKGMMGHVGRTVSAGESRSSVQPLGKRMMGHVGRMGLGAAIASLVPPVASGVADWLDQRKAENMPPPATQP